MNKKLIIFICLIAAALLVSGCVTGNAKGGKGGAAPTECKDGIDNDGDGYCDTDHRKTKCTDGSTPGDTQCTSKGVTSEGVACTVACSTTSDCGTDGNTGVAYCGTDDNVYQDSAAYTCSAAGTCDSACSTDTTSVLVETCTLGCTAGVCDSETVDLTPTAAISDVQPSDSGETPFFVILTGVGTGGDAPLTYAWDFGDSTTATGATGSHTYFSAGSFTATLTVTDADGDTATASRNITVTQGSSGNETNSSN
ncbi:MAG: PKD repeat protein [Candidatus Woesearchaeota archaeon]|jgi:PKD repeat protein